MSSFYLLCLFIGACFFFKQDNLSYFSFIFHTLSSYGKDMKRWFDSVNQTLSFELHLVQLEVMGRSEGFASFDDELRSLQNTSGCYMLLMM